MPLKIACFISSHGFGHAARVAAVIEAAQQRYRDLVFELFTGVPAWFFEDSISDPPKVHSEVVDFGLVQRNSLDEDLGASVERLRAWVPPPADRVERFADKLRSFGADLVLCDIAPLGIAAAHRAGIPSVLLENFTWDFIYRGYRTAQPELGELADQLTAIFAGVDHRIQAEPFCQTAPGAVWVPPIGRRPRKNRSEIRAALGIRPDDLSPMALLTMGGIAWSFRDLEHRLAEAELSTPPWLVIPGGSEQPVRRGRTLCLPHRSDLYHPDLVHAADAVVGKLGYSTVAEVAAAGVPFGFVARDRFPESPHLEKWVRAYLPSLRIAASNFLSGAWIDDLATLLALEKSTRPSSSGGAAAAAAALVGWLPHPVAERSPR